MQGMQNHRYKKSRLKRRLFGAMVMLRDVFWLALNIRIICIM